MARKKTSRKKSGPARDDRKSSDEQPGSDHQAPPDTVESASTPDPLDDQQADASPKPATTQPQAQQPDAQRQRVERNDRAFPIVGVGASAGGLDALKRLLSAMPDDPGIALVIIQHLDPTRKSLGPELLAKSTSLPVEEVQAETPVVVNHVYVIPPGSYLSIADNMLQLSELQEPRSSRMAVDFFLRSLARHHEHRAVSVILSGAGTDGTLGCKAIRRAGGLAIAQDPSTAEHDSMVRSAIEAGAIDDVLAPEDIPPVLTGYARHPYVQDGDEEPPADEVAPAKPPEARRGRGDLQDILGLLRAHTGHDFRNYKDRTIVRRTERRMSLHHFENYADYVEYIREHPEEIEALHRDLLISVTDFFRDPEAWEELAREVIAPIVESKDVDEAIRVWVPGCATGEEPYSLAMLIFEERARQKKHCPVKLFASDIDRRALELARAGRYPKSIETDVPEERLRHFFTRKDDDSNFYRVSKTLREAVVFAEQNLISDPPFSRVDLICCRNLLIYLKPGMQEKVLRLFHFALLPHCWLFLGTSETIGRREDLFTTVSKRSRIYRRRNTSRDGDLEIPLTTAGEQNRTKATGTHQHSQPRLAQTVERQLVEMLSPTAVLVNSDCRILHLCGDLDAYLTHMPGTPSDNLLVKARRGLKTRLRAAIHSALNDQRPVCTRARVQRQGRYFPVQISIRPISDHHEQDQLALVVFRDADGEDAARKIDQSDQKEQPRDETRAGRDEDSRKDSRTIEDDSRKASRTTGDDSRTSRSVEADREDFDQDSLVRHLEDELETTRDELQSTTEQMEVSNEEYRAANEEVMSVNEELQSTNEELETSQEELQSVNEELSTVNSQLASKVEELENKHDDLTNLLRVTDLAAICLDNDLTIRWFSEATTKLFRLTSADIGRPISDFTHDFIDGDIDKVVEQVLDRLTPDEREVAASEDRWFLRRTVPYRTEENRIEGVVITLMDITERKNAEESLRQQYSLSQRIIDTVRESTLVLDADLRVVSANQPFYRQFDVTRSETEGVPLYELGNGQWNLPRLRHLLEEVLPQNRIIESFEVEHDFKSLGRRVMLLNARRLERFQMILLAIEDITQWRQAEQRQQFLLELSDDFSAAMNPADLLKQAAGSLCRFLKADRTVYGEIDFRQEQINILVQYSDSLPDVDETHELAEFGEPALRTLQQNQALVIDDVREDDRTSEPAHQRAFEQRQTRAIACLPRIRDDNRMALMAVGFAKPHQWTSQDTDLIRQVADRTWSALAAARAEEKLQWLNESLEIEVRQRTEILALLQDITRTANEANTVEGLMAAALARIAAYDGWRIGHVWKPTEDGSGDMVSSGIWHIDEDLQPKPEHLDNLQQLIRKHRVRPGEGLVGKVISTGEPQWVDDMAESGHWNQQPLVEMGLLGAIAFPATVNSEVAAVLEFFSTEPARRDAHFMEIMPDVGIQIGRVIERKRLEKLVADATEAEQRRIGRDMHDGLGQEFTGIRYLTQTLADALKAEESSRVPLAEKITGALGDAHQTLRRVIRDLTPVEIDEEGLAAALANLADQAHEANDARCRFEGPSSVPVEDPLVTTYLYRIAQEAVNNAMKHAEADEIIIRLRHASRQLKLEVIDDGVGMDTSSESSGYGQGIMASRAAVIGARFECDSSLGEGTTIRCTLPLLTG